MPRLLQPGGVLVLLLVAALPALAARGSAAREALRRLAELPRLSFSVKAGFSPAGHLQWEHDTPDPAATAARREQVRQHPDDPEAHLALARWLAAADAAPEAARAYSNAVALYRAQAEPPAEPGHWHARFGEALAGIQAWSDAEGRFQQALRSAPDDPEILLPWARFLDRAAFRELMPESRPTPAGTQDLVVLMLQLQPTPAQLAAAEQRHADALTALDRAIRLAPERADLYEARARLRVTGALIDALKAIPGRQPTNAAALVAATMSPLALPDLSRSAELQPDNPRFIGAAAMFEALSHFLQNRDNPALSVDPNAAIWESLPADARASIRAKLDRLSQLAQSSASNAAEAAEILGILRLSILQDFQPAETAFQRALALQPDRETAWSGLIASLASQEKPAEMLRTSEALVKRADSARHRLYLAKAHAALGRWDAAVEQSRLALQREPDSFLAHSTLAAALIRAGKRESDWREAGIHLRQALNRIAQADPLHRIHLRFTTGLVLALTDNRSDAREAFREVLRAQPGHTAARQALSILE